MTLSNDTKLLLYIVSHVVLVYIVKYMSTFPTTGEDKVICESRVALTEFARAFILESNNRKYSFLNPRDQFEVGV